MRGLIAACATCGLLLAGCGSDDDETAGAKPTTGASQVVAATYTPTSDVSSNAAIGKDVAAIRALLAPEGAGAKPDFDAAAEIWSKGKSSTKSDGTNRTLAEWVAKHPAGAGVADALAGTGTAKDLTEEGRVEWIDKGMVVSLAAHALDEFNGAKEKLAAGELDPQEGTIHNVDEVWAYFDAEGEGVVATAAKRAKDFGLAQSALGGAVIAGITAAQAAVNAKDAAGLDAAAESTRGAMNRIFALAVKKYAVEGADDPKARAEGFAFSWGLHGQLAKADLASIQAAFADDAPANAATSVAETLDAAAPKLGFEAPLPPYSGS